MFAPERAVVGALVDLEDVRDACVGQLLVQGLVVVDEAVVRILRADVEPEERLPVRAKLIRELRDVRRTRR